MRVPIKVYLNEGPDNYFGFHNDFADEPRLRLAAAFDITVLEIDTMPGTDWPMRALNEVFEQLNIGGEAGVPATDWTRQYRAERNRSLSVGDVVVVGETAWSCDSYGWSKVQADALTEAIARFNTEGPAHR